MKDHKTNDCHSGVVVWLTGLPCSGKSTLSYAIEKRLQQEQFRVVVLDGDVMRRGLCSDLGYSAADRHENLRRAGEVARLFCDAGVITIAAFISPLKKDREMIRNLMSPGRFFEVFCDSSIDVCESRDVKGMYRKARAGEIKEFTGVSSPYERPVNPELILDTATKSVDEDVDRVLQFLYERHFLSESCKSQV